MSMNKKNTFVMIPESLGFNVKLQHIDIRVYFALRSYRNETKKSRVYPSRSTLAKRIGCHLSTIHRSIKRLEALGYIEHRRGTKGRPNSYQFLIDDSSTDAIMSDALERLGERRDAGRIGAPVQHEPDPLNQTHKPEALRLYHRNDLASVADDGHIRIRIHTGQWVDYGGGDDDGFCFGNLHGPEARKAAIQRYAQSGEKP